MRMTKWADVPGYEGRYVVSELGEVRAIPFFQRYLLRNGAEAWRRTKERVLAQPVRDPATGTRYDSITQAAKGAHKSHRDVSKKFIKEETCLA